MPRATNVSRSKPSFGVIVPGHSGRHKMMSGADGALLGTQDRGDDVIGCARDCRAIAGADVEGVVLEVHTVGFFALNEGDADRRGCHRHTKYDLHRPSKHSLGIFGSRRGSGGSRRCRLALALQEKPYSLSPAPALTFAGPPRGSSANRDDPQTWALRDR